MNKRVILLVGQDRISRSLRASLPSHEGLIVVEDKSSNAGRVIKLIRRRSLTLGLVAKMFFCEIRRKVVQVKLVEDVVSRNTDLAKLISNYSPHQVILFRAGLIISRSVLDVGVPILNIHCARLPDFGGVGTIDRALRARAYGQCATLHVVTESIDSGTVIDTEPYTLDPCISYCLNEDLAYEAGKRLLFRTLGRLGLPDKPGRAG